MSKLILLLLVLSSFLSCSTSENSEDIIMGNILLPETDDTATANKDVLHVSDLLVSEDANNTVFSNGESVHISCTDYISKLEKCSDNEKSILLSKDIRSISDRILILVNEYRQSMGLNPLISNTIGVVVATDHCVSQIKEGKASHRMFPDRFCALVNVLGAYKISENTARGQSSAKEVVEDWIASDIHRANLLGDFDEIGIATLKSKATGQYYFTQMFMKF